MCLTATQNRTLGRREGSLREQEERETAGDSEFNLSICSILFLRRKIHVLLDLQKYYYVRLGHVLVQVFLLIKSKSDPVKDIVSRLRISSQLSSSYCFTFNYYHRCFLPNLMKTLGTEGGIGNFFSILVGYIISSIK